METAPLIYFVNKIRSGKKVRTSEQGACEMVKYINNWEEFKVNASSDAQDMVILERA